MKKSKYLLIAMLLLMPTIVLASDGSGESGIPLVMAIGMEAFVSIHMSAFVLSPLSKIISKDDSKKTFWILFGIRAAILLFCDLFVTTGIAFVDFMAVFVGAFIVIPISAAVTKTPLNKRSNQVLTNLQNANISGAGASPAQVGGVILKCTKCGNTLQTTDQVCPNCGAAIEGDNIQVVQDTSPVVQMDRNYIASEKSILKNIIIEELKNQGESEKTLSIASLNTKKNILLILIGIVTFISVLMYYFNYSFIMCAMIEGVSLLIYCLIAKNFNIINVITKKAVKSPDEDISNIIRNIASEKKETILPSSAKLIITILAIVVIQSLFFMTPKLLYQKVGDGYYVLRYTRGLLQQQNEVVIPQEYKGKAVIGIQENAFKNTTITKVQLPYGLESIKTKAFYNCDKLTEITIPSTVTEIRASAFENNTSLVTVNLSEGIRDIRASAFKNCVNLKNIKLPDSLEYLGASAFSHCSSLEEITIPKKVIEINGQTFEYCTSLRTVNLHDDIISIHGETFVNDVSLQNIQLPSKITEIRGNTFENCSSLTSIVIPEGVTRIGGHAFYGCTSLSSVIIPSTVNEIGSSAFRQCYSLYSVRVPYNAYINERAFKESPTSITRY